MGLRKLLTTQPAEDPLGRLTDEPSPTGDPPGRFAPRKANGAAAFPSPMAVEKKPESGRPVIEQEGRRPNYVRLSERSRRARADWADVMGRPF